MDTDRKEVVFHITPIPKPRMTKSDKWKKRPVVMSYWAYKDELNLWAKKTNLPLTDEINITCIMPMPKSWSKKKKEEMNGQKHKQKPDWDNLAKAICDSLYGEDSVIWSGAVKKYWGYEGKVIFHLKE